MTDDPTASRDARVAAQTRSSARRGSRARVLAFIGVCFVASAAVRIGEVGAEVANARDRRDQPQDIKLAQAAAPEPTKLRVDAPRIEDETPDERKQASAPPPQVCEASPTPLLAALREQAAALRERETRVAERERLLEVASARVRQEIARLEETEAKLAETLAIADGAAERDVEHLVGVYENMKAKQAAEIFDGMDPDFAAGFLSRMRQDAAAGILAAMGRESAYAVTAVMAGRHVGVGRGLDAPASAPTRTQ